jgi:hypothetical protein
MQHQPKADSSPIRSGFALNLNKAAQTGRPAINKGLGPIAKTSIFSTS